MFCKFNFHEYYFVKGILQIVPRGSTFIVVLVVYNTRFYEFYENNQPFCCDMGRFLMLFQRCIFNVVELLKKQMLEKHLGYGDSKLSRKHDLMVDMVNFVLCCWSSFNDVSKLRQHLEHDFNQNNVDSLHMPIGL